MRALDLGEATLADLGLRQVVVRRLLDERGFLIGYGRAVVNATGRSIEVRVPEARTLYEVLVRTIQAAAFGDA